MPIYLHDYYGPGRHAKVVSTKAKELHGDGNTYRAKCRLTGDESRVAEVKDVGFRSCSIRWTICRRRRSSPTSSVPEDGKVLVRGTTSDNGTVKRVRGRRHGARALTGPNFAEWEVVLEAAPAAEVRAHAEDAAGNVEKRPHEWTVGR